MATTDTQRPKSILVILRRAYLEIVEGNHCAAKLIEYFKHWREWKLKTHRTDWIYMPVRQIYDDLMGEHSVNIIRRAINLLVSLGILEQRHNPGNGQDKTWQYKLNLGVLQSLLNRNDQPEIKSDRPLIKSDQALTQDQSSNITSTEQVGVEERSQCIARVSRVEVTGVFTQEEPKQVLEHYEQQLKLYGIYRQTWQDDRRVDNPRLKPILAALARVPSHGAERSIQAFLKWMRTAKNVEDQYRAMEVFISKGWQPR